MTFEPSVVFSVTLDFSRIFLPFTAMYFVRFLKFTDIDTKNECEYMQINFFVRTVGKLLYSKRAFPIQVFAGERENIVATI